MKERLLVQEGCSPPNWFKFASEDANAHPLLIGHWFK